MSNIKRMADWIYENAGRDLDRKRDMELDAITEDHIENSFITWMRLAKIYPDFQDLEIEDSAQFINKLIHDYKIQEDFLKPVGFRYQDDQITPWLVQKKDNIEWFYWERYRKYLRDTKHWSRDTLRSMDRDTDNILDGIANSYDFVLLVEKKCS